MTYYYPSLNCAVFQEPRPFSANSKLRNVTPAHSGKVVECKTIELNITGRLPFALNVGTQRGSKFYKIFV